MIICSLYRVLQGTAILLILLLAVRYTGSHTSCSQKSSRSGPLCSASSIKPLYIARWRTDLKSACLDINDREKSERNPPARRRPRANAKGTLAPHPPASCRRLPPTSARRATARARAAMRSHCVRHVRARTLTQQGSPRPPATGTGYAPRMCEQGAHSCMCTCTPKDGCS